MPGLDIDKMVNHCMKKFDTNGSKLLEGSEFDKMGAEVFGKNMSKKNLKNLEITTNNFQIKTKVVKYQEKNQKQCLWIYLVTNNFIFLLLHLIFNF